jgi:SAM-dependent methyltransferase
MLDVGCGPGLRLRAFREQGYQVHGMDFDPKIVQYVRNHLGIPAVATDFEGLGRAFPAQSFDLITAFAVMEHVTDVATMLRTCFDLLKPGSWFVAMVPLVDSIQAQVLKARWAAVTEAPRHVTLPSQEGMMRACRRAGFGSIRFRPDTALNGAAYWGLSLLPGVTPPHLQKVGLARKLITRACGASLALLALPWSWVEGEVLGRPALGLYFARRPIVPVGAEESEPGE